MLAVGGDAAQRAADGVVGNDGRAPLVGNGLFNAHVRAPSGNSGAGPALRHGGGLVSVVLRLDVGVGIDDAVLIPLMEQVQVLHDLGLLVDGNDLALGIVVLDAHGDQAGAHGVVGEGQVGSAGVVQRPCGIGIAILNQIILQSLAAQSLGQLGIGQILHGGAVIAGSIHGALVPNDKVGDGGVLHGGHSVDLAAHTAGIPVISGDGGPQVRSIFLHQIGDVQEGAHAHVVGVGVHVGEQDVILAGGVDDDVAALIPVAPANDLNVDVDADLLFQVGVDLGQPGIVVRGHAVADHDPLEGNDLAVSGRGLAGTGGSGTGGGGVPAAGGQAQRHNAGHAESEHFLQLFHAVSPFM